MPKKVMENIYLYDNDNNGEKTHVRPDKYNEPLFQDIDREMQTRTLDGQVDFMMDLALFQMALPADSHEKKVINSYISNFFLPQDANKNLRKDEFESRMEKLAERQMKRIYYPEGKFSFEQHKNHSDECIAQMIALSKPGLMELGILNSLMPMYEQNNVIAKAYNVYDAAVFFDNITEQKQQKILDSMSEEDRKIGLEGLNYIRTINAHEYTKEEKEAQKVLEEKDIASGALIDIDKDQYNERKFDKAGIRKHYYLAKDTDLSFISDHNIYNSIQKSMLDVARDDFGKDWCSDRRKDNLMDDFTSKMSNLDGQLFDKKVNGTRLFDSKEFNTIKDDLKKLQKDIQKGNKTETLKNLRYSMEIFSEHCQKYLDKNQGKRRERGEERKRIVSEIKTALDNQIKSLDKALGKEFHEKDNEWVDINKEERKREGIKLSYVDLADKHNEWVKVDKLEKKTKLKLSHVNLADKHNEPINRISRPSNPAKDGPAI